MSSSATQEKGLANSASPFHYCLVDDVSRCPIIICAGQWDSKLFPLKFRF